jgi:hypothetical protein
VKEEYGAHLGVEHSAGPARLLLTFRLWRSVSVCWWGGAASWSKGRWPSRRCSA